MLNNCFRCSVYFCRLRSKRCKPVFSVHRGNCLIFTGWTTSIMEERCWFISSTMFGNVFIFILSTWDSWTINFKAAQINMWTLTVDHMTACMWNVPLCPPRSVFMSCTFNVPSHRSISSVFTQQLFLIKAVKCSVFTTHTQSESSCWTVSS